MFLILEGFDNAPFTETGDIIQFYNTIYVQVMKDIIVGFANRNNPVSDLYDVLNST